MLSFWLILRKMKGEYIMKQVLIIAVAVIIAAVDFVMYCCLRVASQEDRILEKLSRRSESESDDIVIPGMKRTGMQADEMLLSAF